VQLPRATRPKFAMNLLAHIAPSRFIKGVAAQAIRSMKAPGTAYDDPVLGKDPQPGHMRDYVHTVEDNGGVHINSGIPNRAFYEAAVRLGGYACEKAGLIWYKTLCVIGDNYISLRIASPKIVPSDTAVASFKMFPCIMLMLPLPHHASNWT